MSPLLLIHTRMSMSLVLAPRHSRTTRSRFHPLAPPRNRRGTRVLLCSALTTRFGPAFGSAVGTNMRRKGAVQAEGFKLTVVTDCNRGCNWTCAMSCGTECSVGAVVAVQSGLSFWVTGRLLRRLHHGILKLPLGALGRDSRYPSAGGCLVVCSETATVAVSLREYQV